MPSKVTLGSARFTVINPYCIRLEYSENYGFIDAPTLFAKNRDVCYEDAIIETNGNQLTIDTGFLKLSYCADGKSFNDKNLTICFGETSWVPGQENKGNLGGAIATLDSLEGPVDLPDGLLSRDGWALVDDSGRPVMTEDWIEQRRGGIAPSEILTASSVPHPDIDWYFFGYGNDYTLAFDSLREISGRVPMPRKHVLGSWYCRWFRYSDEQFREIVQEYRDHDFPLDIMVMDMDWHLQKEASVGQGHAQNLGWTGYTWDRTLIKDPKGLLKEFKDDGIYVTLNEHPHDGVRDHEECYPAFMKHLGLEEGENLPFNAGSKKYMEAFFETALAPLEDDGVDFWWLDWQQDYLYHHVYGIAGLPHLPWLNYLYYKHSETDNRRGQSFSRWGGWGDHRHPIQFSGDAHAGWEMLNFQVPFTLSSGNVGCFFWAHDLGGFHGERDPEMYTRWLWFGAFSASLRLHSSGDHLDRRPWLWGELFENSMRKAYHLRSKLFPYIYTSVRECYDQTIPLLRPMYLTYPEADEAYKYDGQYFFGDDLLVAPITSPGSGENYIATKDVWFPEGTWYHLLTGECIEGGQVKTVEADISEMPIYVRGGVPLTMQPYQERMATAKLDTLVIRCYPGSEGERKLYEDDGQSIEYQNGECAWTTISYKASSDVVEIDISAVEGHYDGQPLERSYKIELPSEHHFQKAFVNDIAVPICYDSNSRMSIIEVSKTSITEGIHLRVE